MTKEEKELLFIDLCARLPYGVCYKHLTWDDERGEECIAAQIYSINSDGYVKNCYDDETVYIDNVRPYLFPLSSMTEEQKKEINKRYINSISDHSISIRHHSEGYWDDDTDAGFSDYLWIIDWFNKNHFDYRGLIEKSLALDATGLNVY